MRVFISHTHADHGLADALRDLIKVAFGDKVSLEYSSDQSAGGGIAPGNDWLEWILNQIKESQCTLVFLTPRSTSKPWVLWETGAVTGAAIAAASTRPLIPVSFRVDADQIPGPMKNRQGVNGEEQKGVLRLMQTINQSLDNVMTERVLDLTVRDLWGAYHESVQKCLADQPLALNEAAVQEWISRIEDLRAEKRYAEVKHIHRALVLAYGDVNAGGEPLLDQRLHRRLGEMFLAAKQPDLAVAQFENALKTGSRDVFLLHKLALAEVERANLGRATEILDRIAAIDPNATVANAEIAGIRGRIFRERWKQSGSIDDLRQARDAYAIQWRTDPNSYYMADNVGQLSLFLGERDFALKAFMEAERIIQSSGEDSIWSNATLAAAAIVRDDDAAAIKALTRVRALSPQSRHIDSILGGLGRIRQSLNLDATRMDAWKRALGQ